MRSNMKSKLMLLVVAGVFFTGNFYSAIAMADLYDPTATKVTEDKKLDLDIDAPPAKCCKKAVAPAKKAEPATKSETDAIAVANPKACTWQNVGGKFACVFLPPSQAPGGYLWVQPKTPRLDKAVKDIVALETGAGLLDGRVTDVEDRVQTLESRKSTGGADLDEVNGRMSRFSGRIAVVEEQNQGTAAALTGITGRLDGIDGKLGEIDKTLERLDQPQKPAPVPVQQPVPQTGAALAPPPPPAPIIVPVQPTPVQQNAPVVSNEPSWASKWVNFSMGMNFSLAVSGVDVGAGIGHRSDGIAVALRAAVGVGYVPHSNKNYGHVFPTVKLAFGATLGNYFEGLLYVREAGDPTVGTWGKWGTNEMGVSLGASLAGLLQPKEWYSNIVVGVDLGLTKAGGPFFPGEGKNIGVNVIVPF